MYGFVNRAIELLVLRKFGQELWDEIKREAGIELPSHFLVRVTYPDNITYALVGAAEKVLKVPAAAILELFGAFFYEFCVESGYDRILQVLGSTTADFLNNLDALHDHLATIYPGMRAPSFRCTNVENGIILHYYSERPGLEPIVVGLVKTVAKELHGSIVKVTVMREKSELANKDHVQFLIQEEHQLPPEQSGPTISGNELPPAQGLPITVARGANATLNTINFFDSINAPHETLSSRLSSSSTPTAKTAADAGKKSTHSQQSGNIISPDTFAVLFPFHIMFDRQLQVLQAGASVCRLLPQLTSPYCYIDTVFDLVRPRLDFTFDSLLSHINTITILETKAGLLGYAIHVDGHARHLRLKGQMIHLPGDSHMQDAIVFVASPSVTSLDDMVAHSIRLSDVPVHDATRDLVLMSEHWSHEYKLAQNLEYFVDMLQQTYKALDEEKLKTDNLLYSVLPPSVAARLKQNQSVPAERYRTVTLLFTGIVGFNEYCRMHGGSRGAMIIVEMLNTVFSAIDTLVDVSKGKVYKIETVQDHYVAVSGLPEPCEDHAKAVAELALNLMDNTSNFIDSEGNAIKITIGIHSGEVVTGVIGNKAPRYCLFGNTVNIASRTLTCGVAERINVSETAYEFLTKNDHCRDPERLQLDYRGEVDMKGRARPMLCYLLSRTPQSISPTTPAAQTSTTPMSDKLKSPEAEKREPAASLTPKRPTTIAPPQTVMLSPPARGASMPQTVTLENGPLLDGPFRPPPQVTFAASPAGTPGTSSLSSPSSPPRLHPAATTVHRSSRIANHHIARVDVVKQQRPQHAVPIASRPIPAVDQTNHSRPATTEVDGDSRKVSVPSSNASTTSSSNNTASSAGNNSSPAPKRSLSSGRPTYYVPSTSTTNRSVSDKQTSTFNNVQYVDRSQQTQKSAAVYRNGPSAIPPPFSPPLYNSNRTTASSAAANSISTKQLPAVASAAVYSSATHKNKTPAAAVVSQQLARHQQYFSPETQHRRRTPHSSTTHSSSSRPIRYHTHDNNYYLPQQQHDDDDERIMYASPRELANSTDTFAAARPTTATAGQRVQRFPRPPRIESPNDNKLNDRHSKNSYRADSQFDAIDGNNNNNEQVYVRVKPSNAALSTSNTTPLQVTRAVQIVTYTPAFVNTALVQADTEQVHPETKGRPRWRLYKVTRV